MSEAARRGGPMAAALFSVLLLAASPAAAQRDFADGPLEFLRRVPPFGFFFGDAEPGFAPNAANTCIAYMETAYAGRAGRRGVVYDYALSRDKADTLVQGTTTFGEPYACRVNRKGELVGVSVGRSR